MVDKELIRRATRMLLVGLGEDPDREGLKDTPKRVARMWEDLLSVKSIQPTCFTEQYDQMIVIKDIPFHSFCEHHIIPFFGIASVAYIPSRKVLGLSKLVRTVLKYSKALQLQERMTNQVADEIVELVKPSGVGVIVEARHLCIEARGVQRSHNTITSALRGAFLTKRVVREEFLKLARS